MFWRSSWLVLSFVVGWPASQKARSGGGFLLLSLLLAPLIGLPVCGNPGSALKMESESKIQPLSDDAEATGAISARERDLDNFLLEELSASEKFRVWLFSRLARSFDVPPNSRLEVGKNPKREVAVGQTDLSVVCLDQVGNRVALLLIESKVALGFQPGQPDRYKLEIDAARNRLGHRHAAAIVVAPRSNQQVLNHSHFDGAVQIEEIIDHLRSRIDSDFQERTDALVVELRARLTKKIELLEYLAGKRAQSNWSPNPIPARLNFMELYRQLALEIAPGLTATQSSGGGKATTVLFTGLQVPGLNCKTIRHDFGNAHRVSLVLAGAAAAKAQLLASGLLPSGARLDTTDSGSLLIRLAAPPINPSENEFAVQRSTIKKCIERVLELEAWGRTHAKQLAALLQQPGPV